MSDLVQLNLSVDARLRDDVDDLAGDHPWTKRQVITTAVEGLAYLMDRHERAAAKASEPDVAELFLRLARLMPARLVDAKVEHGRFSDGRPALIVTLADDDLPPWVIGPDQNDDLMAVRQDGSQIGHITRGQIQVLADRALGEIRPLQPSAAEVALN
jgi:hypothetical protein